MASKLGWCAFPDKPHLAAMRGHHFAASAQEVLPAGGWCADPSRKMVPTTEFRLAKRSGTCFHWIWHDECYRRACRVHGRSVPPPGCRMKECEAGAALSETSTNRGNASCLQRFGKPRLLDECGSRHAEGTTTCVGVSICTHSVSQLKHVNCT